MPTYKAPRLKTFDYVGPFAYSLTIVTAARRREFADAHQIQFAESQLAASAGKFDFQLLAYCFMPDHLHLLPCGTRPTSDLQGFIRHFKQMTGFAFKQETGRRLWQPSYWDHLVRVEEDLEAVANYIWANPYRAGLVEDWTSYRGSGPRELLDVLRG